MNTLDKSVLSQKSRKIGKTAVLYARVSTVKQTEKELPLESMMERQRAKAERMGCSIINEFVDKSQSGSSDRRSEFQAMIDYCLVSQPDYLICWSTSRFARSQYDSIVYKQKLSESGVKLVYVSMDIDSDTEAGWLTERFMEIMDEMKSRDTSRDTLRSMVANAKSGFFNGGRPPLGYRAEPSPDNPKKKRLVVVNSEAALVRKIFAYKAAGLGGKGIADALNQAGEYNRARKWTKGAVLSLLRNPTITGKTVFGRKTRRTGKLNPAKDWLIVPSHAGIIPDAEFQKIQKTMDRETNQRLGGSSPRSQWLFTGLLVCGVCGASIQTETATGRAGKRYSYYRCLSARRTGSCDAGRMPCAELDDWLKEKVLQRVLSKQNLDRLIEDIKEREKAWKTDSSDKLKEVREELERTEQKRRRLFDLLEQHPADLHLADITPRIREHSEKINLLEAELAALVKEPPIKPTPPQGQIFKIRKALIEAIKEERNPHKIRGLFAELLESVEINRHNAKITYRPDLIVAGGQKAVRSRKNWLPEPGLLRTNKAVFELPDGLMVKRSA